MAVPMSMTTRMVIAAPSIVALSVQAAADATEDITTDIKNLWGNMRARGEEGPNRGLFFFRPFSFAFRTSPTVSLIQFTLICPLLDVSS